MSEQVALWFYRNFRMDYKIFDSEAEAAKHAVALAEYNAGSTVGIQFSDGRIVRREDWEAYRAAETESFENYEQVLSEKRPTRTILNPFNGAPMKVEADEPEWLGKTIDGKKE